MGTIRKYAHELYPHAAEGEVRPLAVEVPYLYARMVGLSPFDTGWGAAPWRDDKWARRYDASLPTEHQPGAHRRMLTYVRTDVDVPLAVAS